MVQEVVKEQVKVPAHISYLRVLRKFVTRIGTKYGFSASELYAFKASVDEACSNIIEHGYGFKDGSITIKAIVGNNSLTIELIDQGKAFDPKLMQDPELTKYVDDRKKGGLGIFIMKRLLDEIDYKRTDEGNVLRLTKFKQMNSGPLNSPTTFITKIRDILSS
ncbi:ATP-binding protein [candidate division KSB1 bacterium]|nr:ATP-binding protein [candidate division KSB1 bacterium]